MLQLVLKAGLVVPVLLAAWLDGHLRVWLGVMRPGPLGAVWVHGWCRRLAWAIGVEVEIAGPLPKAQGGMLAVVSNHMSYLDILLYSAARPFVMVSKTEVRGWPLIGWITAQAGTIYVQRGDVAAGRSCVRQTHAEVNAQMAAAFRSGLPVLFFPEGTTTDGMGILPFRRGLFNSIVADSVPVRTAAIHYELARPRAGESVAEDVCFTGDAEFAPHFFNYLKLRGVRARIRFSAHRVPGEDRFALAHHARQQIVGMYETLGQRVAAPVVQPIPETGFSAGRAPSDLAGAELLSGEAG